MLRGLLFGNYLYNEVYFADFLFLLGKQVICSVNNYGNVLLCTKVSLNEFGSFWKGNVSLAPQHSY